MKRSKSKYQCKKGGRMSLEEIHAGLPLKEEGGFQFDISKLNAHPTDDPLAIFNNTNVPKQQSLLQKGTGLAISPEELFMNGLYKQPPPPEPKDSISGLRNLPQYLNTAFTGIANMASPDYNPTQYNSSLMNLSYGQTSQGDTKVFEQGGIHIKPSHRGRFTEYKRRTGKTTEEALHSPDPHVRQMANFARNAAKWKHDHGGLVEFPGGGEIAPNVLPSGFDAKGRPVSYKKPTGLTTPIDAMKQQMGFMEDHVTNPINMYELEYEKRNSALKNKLEANDKTPINPNDTINLKQGRFRGAKVARGILDRALDTSIKTGVPFGKFATIIGRESTFGQDPSVKGTGIGLKELVSGWDIAEPYKPKSVFKFLHEGNVPGMIAEKNAHRYEFSSNDIDRTKEYLKSHPEMLEKYKQQLSSTPDLGNQSSFDLAAIKLKNEGVRAYNPGDPTYEGMFNKDYNTLAQEQELQNYLKSKGAKFRMGGKYRKKC